MATRSDTVETDATLETALVSGNVSTSFKSSGADSIGQSPFSVDHDSEKWRNK